MRTLLVLVLVFVAFQSLSAKPTRELREIRSGEPVTIRSDKAYFLLRFADRPGVWEFEPVFLRIPASREMEDYRAAKLAAFTAEKPELEKSRQRLMDQKAAAEANGERFSGEIPAPPSLSTYNFIYTRSNNVTSLASSKFFSKSGNERIYLIEAPAGEYVLYGLTYANGRAGLYVCMCLGTVGFEAKAGQVTNLGEFLSDVAKMRSKVPELEAESGFGPSTDTPLPLAVAAVKPAQAGSSVPDAFRGLPVKAADYHAVGRFLEPRTGGINRLVPIPGVLSYDGDGRVIDVKTGKIMPDHF